MLSGSVPFQSYSREASAAAIMQRIREGEFSFSAPQWDLVSNQAKNVIKGLLTVDPKQRITMNEVLSHPWVVGQLKGGYSNTPLMTPDVLSSHSSTSRATETALKATFDAFHMARLEGFRLLDVSAAPLAQRRKLKKSSTDARSSSCSSGSSLSLPRSQHNSSSSSSSTSQRTHSSLTTPTSLRQTSDVSDSVFNYSESKVSAYLSGLPTISDSTEAQLLLSHNLFEEPITSSNFSTINPLLDNNNNSALVCPISASVASNPSIASNVSTLSSLSSKRERDESCEIVDEYLSNNTTNHTMNSPTNSTLNPNLSSSSAQTKRKRLKTIVID
jgi:serine/threonine protein kinase